NKSVSETVCTCVRYGGEIEKPRQGPLPIADRGLELPKPASESSMKKCSRFGAPLILETRQLAISLLSFERKLPYRTLATMFSTNRAGAKGKSVPGVAVEPYVVVQSAQVIHSTKREKRQNEAIR